jgi:asparagine synthase (glutamine-hydrolysing)
MCGITGWVDFADDLRFRNETLEAMTRTMAARGPDDHGTWVSPHAALGHRRLAIIDPPGGAQPMTAEHVVLTYSGEVYNYRELRRELETAGHVFRTRTDTEVVLRAYLQWGTGMLERLNGMYAFAIWDGKREELLLVRDRLGVKPLYYYRLADGLLFGSEPKAILAHPRVERVLDTTGFCSFLTMLPTQHGRTAFRDIFELEPGHYLRVSRSGLHKQRYWALESRPHEDDYETTVATVRGLLEDIVARQLVADVPLCVLLSGGIDSSTITALARRAQHGELRSFAVDFTGYTEAFRPVGVHDSPDAPFAHEAARHVGSAHRDIVVRTDELWDPVVRSSVLRAWDLPNHIADMDISLYLLFRAIREHSTVAISGEAADEVFGGYPWAHHEQALQLPMFPWMAWMASQMEQGIIPPFGLIDPAVAERLKLWDFLFGAYSEALAEVPRLDGEEGTQARMREVAYFDLTRWVRGLLDRKDRMSMAVGLEVRVPFCDHRLVEYVFNVPWSMKNEGGRPKALLRDAAKDLLPPSIVERPKSAFPITQDIRYDQMLQAELGRILQGHDEPVRSFVDLDTTNRVVAMDAAATSGMWARMRMEAVVRANAWLKEYGVDTGEVRELRPVA